MLNVCLSVTIILPERGGMYLFIWACMCVCVCARVMGVYSCNIHPYCESPDLTALLILLYVTEPVHLVQSPPHYSTPNPHTHSHLSIIPPSLLACPLLNPAQCR